MSTSMTLKSPSSGLSPEPNFADNPHSVIEGREVELLADLIGFGGKVNPFVGCGSLARRSPRVPRVEAR